MPSLRNWLPPLLWTAVILAASSDGFSAANSGSWLARIFGREPSPAVHFLIRKAAHLFEYAVLALLTWRAARRTESTAARPSAVAVAVAAAVALADEGLQVVTPSRTGSGWDILLDLTGAAIALAAANLLTRASEGAGFRIGSRRQRL